MAEATQVEAPKQRFPIARNNTVAQFTPTEIKKGGDKGQSFLMFDEKTPTQDIIAFYGEQEVRDILWSKSRIVFQEITKAATNQNGDFSLELFKTEVQNLSARTESKASLVEKKDKLVSELTALTADADNMEATVFISKMKDISKSIAALNIAIENRSRKKTEEAED